MINAYTADSALVIKKENENISKQKFSFSDNYNENLLNYCLYSNYIVKIDNLNKEFNYNKITAVKKYKGNRIGLIGSVASIDQIKENYYVNLKLNNTKNNFTNISVLLKDYNLEENQKIKPGDNLFLITILYSVDKKSLNFVSNVWFTISPEKIAQLGL